MLQVWKLGHGCGLVALDVVVALVVALDVAVVVALVVALLVTVLFLLGSWRLECRDLLR